MTKQQQLFDDNTVFIALFLMMFICVMSEIVAKYSVRVAEIEAKKLIEHDDHRPRKLWEKENDHE